MKLSNLFNDCVRVAQGLRKGSARSAREWLKSVTVFLLLFTFAVGQMRGASYTLTFNTGSGDGSSKSTSTSASSLLSAGSSYVTGNLATATSVYSPGDYGVKLGVKSGAGDIKINLATPGQVVPTKVSASAKLYNSGKTKTVQVCTNLGNNTATNATSGFADYDYTYSGSSALTYVEVKSSGYIWVQQIVVTYKAVVTFNANGGSCGTSSLTQSTPISTITLPIPTRDGFTCTGWYTEDSGGTKRGNAGATYTPSASETLYAQWESAAPACANTVTITKGASTNCSFSLDKSGAQASCDGVVTTISITPNTGYGTPVVSESGASSTPTKGGSGNSQTLTYTANTTGTSTIAVSCSANTYTINLDKDLTPTSAGTPSLTATYNSNSNLTSAITPPTKTGWTFAGYFTAKNGGGTQIIDASGNVIASVSGYTDASKNWKYAGNITLYAKWTCTVTWSVNNLTNVYSAQTLTYNGSSTKVASIPGPPSPASYCGDKFVGWTSVEDYVHGTSNLFTTVAGSPNLNSIGSTTFYAVFADYGE